ncbi:hypothetical protein B4U79_17300 [Dinothrombium tinctorium]|uniref:Spaetzle domain-containing protein n=1 Tax=Dinothrombium tinctorium TaxID=1965070 RepID=A0A3S3QUY1_9ACAR|nr:hypothetical protein B4U79_17450 [Dinothrombium tinctorium]RWS14345.1 hypothetical protein B4U79_17301 [Dinothrombium tinctorium]RWS14353.1 hypothetical protein B4U79_17300 [Dinothrombium tinctorium]
MSRLQLFVGTSLVCLLLCFDKVHLKQDFFSLAGKDDSAMLLEQAFSQAGIPLADYQEGPIGPPKLSLLERLRLPFSRTKNRLKLANSLLSKPMKLDDEALGYMDYLTSQRYPSHFLFPPINAINHLYPALWHPNDRKLPILYPPMAPPLPPPPPPPLQPPHQQAIPSQPTPTTTVSSPIPPPSYSDRNSGSNKYSESLNSNTNNYQFGFKPITVRTTAPSIAASSSFNRKSSITKKLSGRSEKKYSNHQEDIGDMLANDIIFPTKIVTTKKNMHPVNPSDLLQHFSGDEWENTSSVDCSNKDLGWCDYSSQYPSIYVRSVVKQCLNILDRMYVEVPENLANFDDFVPFAPRNDSEGQLVKEKLHETNWSWAGYRSKNNMLCDSERRYIRPSIAQDINGRWFLIVQTSLYHQKIPIEVCRNPGGVCNNLNKCSKTARCVQKFTTQLLISLDLDKDDECPIMKLYRFPSACICDSAMYQ